MQPTGNSQFVNETQKQLEFQRRHQEQMLQHQQKLQELQGQITAQYGVGPQGLMFLPFLEQFRNLQPPKTALANHVSSIC